MRNDKITRPGPDRDRRKDGGDASAAGATRRAGSDRAAAGEGELEELPPAGATLRQGAEAVPGRRLTGREPADPSDLRLRAEAVLGRRPADREPVDPTELRQLLHELRVHQTELERQTEELLEAQHQLEASRSHFARLFFEAPVAYLILDRDDLVHEANRVAERLLGSGASLVGEPLARFIVPEDVGVSQLLLERAREDAPSASGDLRLCPAKSPGGSGAPSGTPVFARVYASALREAEDRSVLVALVDLTAQRATEQELREAHRRKDAFLAMLAHELRNPLTPLLTVAQLLARVPDDPQRVLRVAEIVERQVHRLVHVVDDLQETSRIARGEIVEGTVSIAGAPSSTAEAAAPPGTAGAERHAAAPSGPQILVVDDNDLDAAHRELLPRRG